MEKKSLRPAETSRSRLYKKLRRRGIIESYDDDANPAMRVWIIIKGLLSTLWSAIMSGSPSRAALVVFAAATGLVAALLRLDISSVEEGPTSWADAVFVATSAVCVTGLSTVDTATHWTTFGHVVIILGIQMGGLGVMTLAGILILLVSRELGLKQRLVAANENKTLDLGDVRVLLKFVITVSLVTEAAVAVILFPRFLKLGESIGDAAWHAVFYGISAYNNAGFLIHPSQLPGNADTDWWLSAPIALGVVIGSLGTAVHMDMLRVRPRRWTLHTYLTLWTVFLLWAFGAIMFAIIEYTLHSPFNDQPFHAKVLTSLFMGVMPRSGGFNVVPMEQLSESSWWLMDGLMFIGGGTGSTAGGIKVTTLAVLFLAAWAEARGDQDVTIRKRRIPAGTIRIAVAVTLASASTIFMGTLGLMMMTDEPLATSLFEVISAFATCGLSVGLSSTLPDEGKFWLSAMMFIGRVGLLTFGAALSLRNRQNLLRYPEERPAVG